MKGTMMFQKNGRTKSVILKNFQSENKIVKQTFDYMLLDTTNYKIGISSWNQLKDKIVLTILLLVQNFNLMQRIIKSLLKT